MRGLRSIVGVSLLAVAGCSALPRPDTVDSLTRPAITEPAAVAVIKHYNEVGRTADSRLTAELIAGVEAGDLLRQTEAAYKIGRVLLKPVAQPSTFTAGSIGAPEYSGYPMRFVASGNKRIGVWERPSAGAAWRLTVAVASSAGAKVPELKGLRDVPPTEADGVAESPSVAAAKFADYLTTGATSPYATLFVVVPEVSKKQKILADSHAWAATQTAEILEMSDKFTVNAPPAAFRTSSGEVLTFFTLTEAHLMRTPGTFDSLWAEGYGSEAFSPRGQTYRNALTSSTLHQVAVVIPVGKGGKIRVLGFTSQMVDAGGY